MPKLFDKGAKPNVFVDIYQREDGSIIVHLVDANGASIYGGKIIKITPEGRLFRYKMQQDAAEAGGIRLSTFGKIESTLGFEEIQ